MPLLEPPPNASLSDIAKATLLVNKIEEMGFVLGEPDNSDAWSWCLSGVVSFPEQANSYRHIEAPGLRLVESYVRRGTYSAVEIRCPSRTAQRGLSHDSLDADVARVFAVDAFFEYCVALKAAKKRVAEVRARHKIMTEEFNDPTGWRRSAVVCVLQEKTTDTWSLESEGAPASVRCSGLTRAAMRVIASQIRAINQPHNDRNNDFRPRFDYDLEHADEIDGVPLPAIPEFPRRFQAARKKFKDWSWTS